METPRRAGRSLWQHTNGFWWLGTDAIAVEITDYH